ncbi:single-stranded DNA-binding protein [Nocardia sp. CS682]|uniref:single-stranded DNA-binding protein n=1 Tax=Nocardia sp. CS682 TaxID=1047172 RepID=UPI001074DC9D|nr:single-stranded DNA-binding protein [Nocardia sp. CS682]QBS43592.1 single-stranded DNA-binding protein [Nocardia sp. CS682]
MYEANATVIGTIVNNPVKRDLSNGEQVLSFRMASNSRRLDRTTGEWVDNGTLFLTVNCWRRLVAGVEGSLRRGDPVIAHGQLRSLEYRSKDGSERRDLEMRASAVGPDLARCVAQVTRWSEMRNTGDGFGAEQPGPAGDGPGENVAAAVAAPPRTTHPEHADA